ncbi:hypothetical protein K5D32_01535 [Pseudomonas cichorii]|uniref:hypothetical protein n=1 Tax=Pseudomonas cichorii TaxID=36746 RepID=UPI001C89EA19|nr:hypothetical protein [Pseudomonas cichorii]MBX8528325.1 hypothetical protein [Pseudomonas cichorii]
MDELKYFLRNLDEYIYLGLLVSGLIAIKSKSGNSGSLFIWSCSIPLSAFCYIAWVYASGGSLNFATSLIYVFAFSQAGWLGGALAFVGWWGNASILKRAGLWVSIISVISHVLFMVVVLVFGYGSS